MSLTFWLKVIIASVVLVSVSVFADSHRGYDQAVLQQGQKIFQTHCAVCHGANAESTVVEWQKPDVYGKMPPPPLNGTAHTWHHKLSGLMHTVKNGTLSIGGNMPGWKDTLSDQEIFSTIIWLTSLWPDEIFETWLKLNNQ